jgi:DNA-directed RNA polymerase specialized sigma24 family protein
MTEDDAAALQEISAKLDTVIRLLAHQVAAQHGTLARKAQALSSAGLGRSDIAAVCGTTANTVSVRLAEAKRKPRTAKNRK